MTATDILVVGGGLAGRIAALTASEHDSDASVTLIGQDNWDFATQSGLIGVLGYGPNSDEPVSNPFEALSVLPASHPYQIVGESSIRDGLATFDAAVGDMYGGGTSDANALLPTTFGRLRPAARYPRSMDAGIASQEREATLVGFEYLPEFDAPPAAERFERAVPYRVTGTTVEFPSDDRDRVSMAETLDDNPMTAEAEPAREALAAAIRLYQTGEERIGLPPVLGLRETEEIIAQFKDAFGVPVFEVPAGVPSVPAIRLGRRLEAALDDASVSVKPQARAETVAESVDSVDAVVLQDGAEISASQYILATGGLTSGGITSDRTTVTEPLFECDVEAPDERAAWAKADPFDSHPFARFGVSVDEQLRPLTASGDREYENVNAAGHVLGGFDPAAENSGGGVAIATGYAAGVAAAAER